ncbi:hypothetical protein ACVWXU_001954 [Streptomyces sp. TE33382]
MCWTALVFSQIAVAANCHRVAGTLIGTTTNPADGRRGLYTLRACSNSDESDLEMAQVCGGCLWGVVSRRRLSEHPELRFLDG